MGHNTRDFLVNKRGLNFGKYWYVEDWTHSLAEAVVNTYGIRYGVFHSGEIPTEPTEGIVDDPDSFQYWNMRNDILNKVNASLLRKILSLNRPERNYF